MPVATSTRRIPPMPSRRKFGVEIEFVGISQERMAEILRENTIPVYGPDGYRESSASRWCVKDDGSVHGRGGGGELTSPPLSGMEGIRQVEKVCRLIAAAGATANTSCGLHVHVDATGLSSGALANLMTIYATYQDRINQILPPSRRNSDYAHGLNSRNIQNIVRALSAANITDRNDIRHIIRNHGLERYVALNLAAYLHHGTVEFRQHSGSTNWRKVTNWIRFCLSMVEKARSMPVPRPARPQTRSEFTPATRTGRRGNFNYEDRRALYGLFTTGMFDVSGAAERIGHSVGTTRRWINNLLELRAIREDNTASMCFVRNQRMPLAQVPALREWLGLQPGEHLPGTPRRRAVSTRSRTAVAATSVALDPTPRALFEGMDTRLFNYYRERAQEFGFSWTANS